MQVIGVAGVRLDLAGAPVGWSAGIAGAGVDDPVGCAWEAARGAGEIVAPC